MGDESRKSEYTDHAELRLKSGKHSLEIEIKIMRGRLYQDGWCFCDSRSVFLPNNNG